MSSSHPRILEVTALRRFFWLSEEPAWREYAGGAVGSSSHEGGPAGEHAAPVNQTRCGGRMRNAESSTAAFGIVRSLFPGNRFYFVLVWKADGSYVSRVCGPTGTIAGM